MRRHDFASAIALFVFYNFTYKQFSGLPYLFGLNKQKKLKKKKLLLEGALREPHPLHKPSSRGNRKRLARNQPQRRRSGIFKAEQLLVQNKTKFPSIRWWEHL